jgi:hypothetical protein
MYHWLFSKALEQGFRFHFISGKKEWALAAIEGSKDKLKRDETYATIYGV